MNRKLLPTAAALAVFVSVLVAGLHAGAVRVRSSFALPPERVFSEELLKTADQADRLLPAQAPVFFVCNDADTWNCGLWQRLLYPRAVFCLRTSNPRHAEIFQDLENRFHIRHVIGTADPPPGLSVVRRTEVSPSSWVGEIGP